MSLQHDTLYVDKRCYRYSATEGRVVEHTVGEILNFVSDIIL